MGGLGSRLRTLDRVCSASLMLEENIQAGGCHVSDIAESIAGAVEYLAANPDEARYTDSPATAKINGLRSTVSGPDGATLVL